MKRARIGDVYAVKVPNGYKLYQWAYKVPYWGDFIRVFDGLFEVVPKNIAEIVAGPHSYILPFYASKAYRVGLARMIDNYPVPEEYPFPDYMLQVAPTGGRSVTSIELKGTKEHWWKEYKVGRIEDLPLEYRDVKVIGEWMSPDIILYLFDTNLSLDKLEGLWAYAYGEDRKARMKVYTDIVEAALEKK